MTSTLRPDTRVLSIGIHPRSLDFSTLPDGVDEAALSERIARGNAALREAGFHVTSCQIDTSPGIRFCFNTAPDNTVDALRRWVSPHP